jgi:hypothetical protein
MVRGGLLALDCRTLRVKGVKVVQGSAVEDVCMGTSVHTNTGCGGRGDYKI